MDPRAAFLYLLAARRARRDILIAQKENSCTPTGRVNTNIKGRAGGGGLTGVGASYNHGDATCCVEYYSTSQERRADSSPLLPLEDLKNSNETNPSCLITFYFQKKERKKGREPCLSSWMNNISEANRRWKKRRGNSWKMVQLRCDDCVNWTGFIKPSKRALFARKFDINPWWNFTGTEKRAMSCSLLPTWY